MHNSARRAGYRVPHGSGAHWERLSLPKISYGANAFEINDIQEQETEASRGECIQVQGISPKSS
jgi:hypothetical protein